MATADQTASREHQGRRTSSAIVLSLLGLTTLGVTQPLLDLIGRNAAFVVAHDLGRLDLLVLTACLAFGAPLALAAVVLLVRRVRPVGADLLHDAIVAVLVTVATLVVLRVGGSAAMPAAVAVGLAVGVGLTAATAYHRSATFRTLVSVTAAAAPAVTLFFLLATPVRGLLFPAAAQAASAGDGPAPPVVMVVFDELPVSTLLTEEGEIDATAFPSFGALAADSTFYSNATASHTHTVEAVPALFSGRYTPLNTLPIASAHPTNIFSVLSGLYTAHALEPLTDLCAVRGCSRETRSDHISAAGVLLRDLGILQLHLATPSDWADALPPVDAAWRDFGAAEGVSNRKDFLSEARAEFRQEDAPAAFRRFVREIKPTRRPRLHVLHTVLPHRPWQYLPDGRLHGGGREESLGDKLWTDREWPMAQSLQRHVAQAQLSDRLLGELLRRLQRTGLYDDALIVVVADHGVSLLPSTPPREATDETIGEIAPVPLFIKTPGQVAGGVVDDPVETVDIMPTMLDMLGIEAPDGLDGRSFAGDPPPAQSPRVMIDGDGKRWEVDATDEAVAAAVRRKVALLGAGPRFDLFDFGPAGYTKLLGQRPDAGTPTSSTLSVRIDGEAAYRDVDLSAPVLPASLTGRVIGLSEAQDPPVIAVAVNGTVAAVTLADQGRPPHGSFRVLVPPAAFRAGANEVAVYVVDPGLRLTHLPRSTGGG